MSQNGKYTRLKQAIWETRQATPVTQPIAFDEALAQYPFAKLTLLKWCADRSPYDRPLNYNLFKKKSNATLRYLELILSQLELDELKRFFEQPLFFELTGAKGIWIAEGIWQNDKGLYFSVSYILKRVSKSVRSSQWYDFFRKRCGVLDKAIDGLEVPSPSFKKGSKLFVVVLFQPHVKEVIQQLTDRSPKREVEEGGEWLTDEILQAPDGDLHFRREYAQQKYDWPKSSLGEFIKVHPTKAYFVSWMPRIFSLRNSGSRKP